MQRMEELKEFLQEYRIERTLAKERNMENDCQCILPELENKNSPHCRKAVSRKQLSIFLFSD